jgi:predicted nucleic acid-binding protein
MLANTFIDSNILLYAFSNTVLEKQQKARQCLKENRAFCISPQVINEVSANLLKKMDFMEDEVSLFVKTSYQRYIVTPLTESTFITASKLRQTYRLSYYDSVIVASALLAPCEQLYSEDMQHGLRINNQLTIINPFIDPP